MVYYFFVDTETVGLNFNDNGDSVLNPMLEVAVIVTDSSLNEIGRYVSQVHYSEDFIEPLMSDSVKDLHTGNGLLKIVYDKNTPVLFNVEEDLLDFIKSLKLDDEDILLLAGSSVHFDREVLRRNLPKVHRLLNFRNFDISSVREFMRFRGFNVESVKAAKKFNHRAFSDIEETVMELRSYKNIK